MYSTLHWVNNLNFLSPGEGHVGYFQFLKNLFKFLMNTVYFI